MSNITVWMDKDGVLAEYDYSIYDPEFGAPAPWTIRNAHVYKNLRPYSNMVAAFQYLYQKNCNKSMAKRDMKLHVLTAVSNGLTLSEHVLDSFAWCQDYLGLNPRDFFATAVAKENIPITLRNELTPHDILLDDYMPNLKSWREKGGTAIKVVNGVNSETKEFPYFYNKSHFSYIVAIIFMVVGIIENGDVVSNGQLIPDITFVNNIKQEIGDWKPRRELFFM